MASNYPMPHYIQIEKQFHFIEEFYKYFSLPSKKVIKYKIAVKTIRILDVEHILSETEINRKALDSIGAKSHQTGYNYGKTKKREILNERIMEIANYMRSNPEAKTKDVVSLYQRKWKYKDKSSIYKMFKEFEIIA